MESSSRNWVIGAIVAVAVVLVLCTCCLVVVGTSWYLLLQRVELPTSDEFPVLPVPPLGDDPGSLLQPSNPTPVAPPVVVPPPVEADETLEALESAVIPRADLHDLGIRFLGVPADTERLAATENPDYPVGTRVTFNASNLDNDAQFDVDAILVYKTEHVYMWVEEGVEVNEEALIEAADLFEDNTYPTNREFFGGEWSPGVDGDPHLSILHAENLGYTVAGYFSSTDEYVAEVREDSNEMEMFYINLENIIVGDDFYNGVLAHEFQHMIHWYHDSNETTWLNEGCSELAMALNDRAYGPGYYDVGGSDYAYTAWPDTQLTDWPEDDASANYGAAYLFMEYFLERFGENATKALVNHVENGMESVDTVLRETLNLDFDHKTLFADWTLANLLDDPTVAGGQYVYTEIDPFEPDIDVRYGRRQLPVTRRSDVRQYGVDYVEIEAMEPLRLTFTGATQAKLLDTDAHSGKYLWWSNRADESDSSLTRIIDLTDASSAEVQFWTWYDIEEDWDYGYLVVGTMDGGALSEDNLNSTEMRWEIIEQGLDCRKTNPNGNNYGCGLTGNSAGWQQQTVDLSAYTGQEIALRFEYITDAAVNRPGLAIDDVTVTIDDRIAIDDDFETGDEAWITQGFVRHANTLPQEWIVQVVTFGDTTEIRRLLMTEDTEGEWVIELDSRTDRAILMISAIAPVTTEPATYTFTLDEVD